MKSKTKNSRRKKIISAALIGTVGILFVGFLLQANTLYNFKQDIIHDPIKEVQISSIISPEKQWHTTWGGAGDDLGKDVVVDSLGNIYLAGDTESYGTGGKDMVLIKYNSLGQQQWNTTWGGSEDEYGNAIVLDSFENIYIAGDTRSFGAGLSDGLLVKYNGLGEQQWNTTWGGSGEDGFISITLDSSDNIFITGSTNSSGAGGRDMVLVKLNGSGQQQWNTTWGGTENDFGWDIALDSSENIFVSGFTNSFGIVLFDIVLVKFNSFGQQQWNTTWGGSHLDMVWAIVLDSANNIFLTGFTSSFGAGSSDGLLIKYNSLGQLQWNTTWGGSDEDSINNIARDSSGNMYITGRTSSFGAGGTDMVLLKYNSLGQKQWNTTWGGSGDETGYGIALDSSENIYLAGNTDSYGAGSKDIVLIKYGKGQADNGSQPIPGYDLFLLLGGISIISAIIIKKLHKSKVT